MKIGIIKQEKKYLNSGPILAHSLLNIEEKAVNQKASAETGRCLLHLEHLFVIPACRETVVLVLFVIPAKAGIHVEEDSGQAG